MIPLASFLCFIYLICIQSDINWMSNKRNYKKLFIAQRHFKLRNINGFYTEPVVIPRAHKRKRDTLITDYFAYQSVALLTLIQCFCFECSSNSREFMCKCMCCEFADTHHEINQIYTHTNVCIFWRQIRCFNWICHFVIAIFADRIQSDY